MAFVCHEENCTVAETGTCLYGNQPETCEKRLASVAKQSAGGSIKDALADLPSPKAELAFTPSLALTPEQAQDLMARRYCTLVGILGAPDAGKTAAIVSLYLLLSKAAVANLSFAHSLSLRALDEISAGARRWNEGDPPTQMTSHTRLEEGRSAGFLHLRLKPSDEDTVFELLLPDLPGEWTTAMVDHSRVDRLQFLRRADVIWLMVDGVQLAEPTTRQLALHRTKMAMQRLAGFLRPCPDILLVVTRFDKGSPSDATLDVLAEEAKSLGLTVEVAKIASFAETDGVPAGTGIRELIESSVRRPSKSSSFWPHRKRPIGDRAIMDFGRGEQDG